MFSSKWSVVALASLTACGGGLSDEQIGTVFAAQSVVSQDVATEVATEVAASGQTGKHLEFEGDLASWNLTGEIEGQGVRWSGVIGVDGSGSYSDTSSDFDLALTYEEVEAVGHDATLDGDLDQGWSVTYEGQNYHAQYDMVGDLSVSGGMKGRAKIDFSMVIDYSDGQFTYEYEGSINGRDVTEMAGAGSGDLM